MKKSVWTDNVNLPEFDSLSTDAKTDVLIVGGGLCGIMCAYYLEQAGVDYILVEGNEIASGITKNTTAKITSQHGLIYSKLLKGGGKEKAQMYLEANQKALEEYERLCHNIDCDFEKKDAYTYSMNDRAKIEEEVSAVNSLGFNADFVQITQLPFEIKGAIRFKNQAQFNPLKFIAKIAEGLKIYKDTFVRELTPTEVITNKGRIRAKKIIAATHFPFLNKHGSYFVKLYQHRSYVSAFDIAPNLNGMYVDEDKKGFSFRNAGNCLLLGGGSHRTGKKGGSYTEVRGAAERFYPEAKEVYRWAAQDCMSLDGIPYIGEYSKGSRNIYVAAGFNKWGMTSAMVAGRLLSDLILEKRTEYEALYSPSRPMLTAQLAINAGESLLGLLSFSTKRCPHFGCALKWNREEHSWDCPCHGSRFAENGILLDNPANDNLKKNMGKL